MKCYKESMSYIGRDRFESCLFCQHVLAPAIRRGAIKTTSTCNCLCQGRDYRCGSECSLIPKLFRFIFAATCPLFVHSRMSNNLLVCADVCALFVCVVRFDGALWKNELGSVFAAPRMNVLTSRKDVTFCFEEEKYIFVGNFRPSWSDR
jgi:hypothetical protein